MATVDWVRGPEPGTASLDQGPRTLDPGQAAAQAAMQQAIAWLLEHQDAEGWWCGELEANVTIQAEYILLMQFLGLRDDDRWAEIVQYIDRRQQEDGGWPIYYDGPSDLSTTIEAYLALKLTGRDPSDPRMRRALNLVRSLGGLPKARIFTKLWLALFGEYPWEGTPVMPPELMFLPPSVPLNIYDFSSWARGTIVPLLIVMTLKPVRPLPEYARAPELREGFTPEDFALPKPKNPFGWRGAFYALDQALRKFPWPGPARRYAIRLAEQWVLAHQEADGSWGGIQPPWVYSLLALNILGYENEHPVIKRSLAGMEAFGVRDHEGWRVQPCVSPIWDTGLAVIALLDAGLERDHPAIRQATQWLLDHQVFGPGDWQVHTPGTPGGGWAFEFENQGYPDTDDTAIVILALWKAGVGRGAIVKAVRWLEGMRSRNGAWGSFDVDNTRDLVTKIPFADFGETLDPPTEDVTAHILEALARLGYPASNPILKGAIEYLKAQQERDGAWWGRWGVNYIYGIGAVLPALRACGMPADHATMRRAVEWLRLHQLPDGGWGESSHTYDDPATRASGPSTPSQTAWALLGLMAAGLHDDPVTRRGIAYLVERQLPDGTWDEPEFTGTGFPRAFMINYHLYRHYFPLMALGRYVHRRTG
ncbi:MAG TPA: squalene--hopene cyclase [Chloroflexota bacterium]|nr:squalene--hopene cyclase [Chloroflexota bacterium]